MRHISKNQIKKTQVQISVSESGRDLPSKTQHQGQKFVSESLDIIAEEDAQNNFFGFFDLAFRIAIRKKIDIGQFENKYSEKNSENYD